MSNALYQSNKDIPDEMLLGNLVFLSLTDMNIPISNLKNIFQNNGLDENFVRNISPADAFRRATSSVKNSKSIIVDPITLNNTPVKFEIDEVRNDKDSVKRILGIKTVDDSKEQVDYTPVGEIIFDRSNNSMIGHVISNNNVSVYEDVLKDIEDKFNEWTIYHNKDTIRNIVNRVINSTYPINLMPTGICKFVPKKNKDTIESLKNALNYMSKYSINSNSENVCEIIPVIDSQTQRDLIKKNFVTEVTDELFEFSKELKSILVAKQSLSVKTAKNYIDKFKEYRLKIEEYENLLGSYEDAIRIQLEESLKLVNDNITT